LISTAVVPLVFIPKIVYVEVVSGAVAVAKVSCVAVLAVIAKY
jgi:hypothetical protein